MSEALRNDTNLRNSLHYRFGIFDLDARSGELRRNGVKLRLQEQPFLVLRKLLESSGGLVTREELHAALWPADTFVDFDTSLNTAIKRLREALGDSADVPVFVETVPRRGYRFLAPVQVLANGSGITAPQVLRATVSQAATKRSRVIFVAAGIFVLVAVTGVALALRPSGVPPRVTDSTQLTFDGLAKGNLHVAGGNIYLNERLSDGEGVALLKVPAAGGLPVALNASKPGLYLAAVSQDGSRLLLGQPAVDHNAGIQLKVMDTTSSSLRDLGDVPVNDATWAPNGKIAVVRGSDIFLADGDLLNEKKILTAPGGAYHLRFSPDGQKMRFTVGKDYIRTIWEARSDGSGLHELFPNWTGNPNLCCGEWTPDGRYFFFQTSQNGATRIWALPEKAAFWNVTPKGPVQITTGPPNFYMGTVSQDGKKLFITAAQPRAELVRYDARVRQFVPYLSGISAGDVEGSPDGRNVVYVKYPELTLWRSKVDGSEATQLTGPSLRVSLPHWSPDGKQIAFSGSRPGGSWNLYLIPAVGGPAQQITSGGISDLDATWSPDGKTLAFGHRRAEGKKFIYSVEFLDVSTGHLTPMADTDGICCPRWSPDGRFLLTSHDAYDDLLLYEFSTQKRSTLVKSGIGYIGFMEWTSDSKYVLFDTFESKDPAFYRLRISDAHLETVTSTQDVRRFYGEFGPWTGMAPDGSPLLVRDISNEEVYALDLQLP